MDEVGMAGSATAHVRVVVVDCLVLVDRVGMESLSSVRRVRHDLSHIVGDRRQVSEPYTSGRRVILAGVKVEAESRSNRPTTQRSIDGGQLGRLLMEEASDDRGIIVLDRVGDKWMVRWKPKDHSETQTRNPHESPIFLIK